jgi:hypothetical protein
MACSVQIAAHGKHLLVARLNYFGPQLSCAARIRVDYLDSMWVGPCRRGRQWQVIRLRRRTKSRASDG